MSIRAAGDQGAATVVAAAAVGVLVLLLGLGLQLGAVTAARHRAETAADLAALAAARQAVRGQDLACARGAEVAAEDGAELVVCEWSGWTVTVRTVAPVGGVPWVFGPAAGRARAGPAALGGPPDRAISVTPRERSTPDAR